jgi:ketosteroid isomerase-like protein
VTPGNLEIARRWVEAINDGDIKALLSLCDSAITFEPVRSSVQGAYRGHAGVREWWTDTSDTFESFRLELDDLRDLGGDRVLALGTLRVRGQGSGVDAAVPSGSVATFREGRVLALKDYGDRAKAMEAAGLADRR